MSHQNFNYSYSLMTYIRNNQPKRVHLNLGRSCKYLYFKCPLYSATTMSVFNQNARMLVSNNGKMRDIKVPSNPCKIWITDILLCKNFSHLMDFPSFIIPKICHFTSLEFSFQKVKYDDFQNLAKNGNGTSIKIHDCQIIFPSGKFADIADVMKLFPNVKNVNL